MGDLTDRQVSALTRLIGADPVTGEETEFVKVTETNDLAVNDQSATAARSSTITITSTPIIANTVGAGLSSDNLANRKQIEIQPLDNTCFVGYSAASQPHRVPRYQFYIAKIGPGVDLYVASSGGTNDLAVSELS